MAARSLGIVADDLSGAAECAAHALLRVSRSEVVLSDTSSTSTTVTTAITTARASRGGATSSPASVVTVDTDSRRLPAEDAVRAVRAAAALVSDARVVVKKVDSLLRGHVAVEVAALAEELRRTPVVAVANPALQRVVRDGVLHVGGTPLHDTDLWAVEPTAAPTRVAEALHPLPTVLVPHTVITLGVDAVSDALAAAADSGLVAVCDAVTEADLEVVHAAATAASADRGRGTLLVGSGALADAAVRALPRQVRHGAVPAAETPDPEPEVRHGAAPGAARSALFVLGTRAPGLANQLARLTAARSAQTVTVPPDELLTDPEAVRARLADLEADGVVVVALDPAAAVDASRSRALTEALSDAVAPVLDRYDAAFLAGGETARAVLDRLGVRSLEVVGQVETGTVVSLRPCGRLVVTRPGSFGDADSLVRVADHVITDTPRTDRTQHATTSTTTSTTNEENP